MSRWATGIGGELHDKLAKVGLVDPRGNVNATSLAEFADQFIVGRADKAEGTLIHYRQAKRLLVEFFGADRPLSAVTAHDADQFRSWLKGTKKTATGKSMALNTVRGHLKNSKLMFGSAVKARRISENPFNGISSQLVKRPGRIAFVEEETIQRVLNACPTARWRAIVVLRRYSGLRCPSEVFALR